MELKGIEYLRKKLILKQYRVRTRYDFYEMKYTIEDLGISTPPGVTIRPPKLGWCTKAVDSLADRLQFKEFDNDSFKMMEIYNMNNPDVIFDNAIISALIGSCSFISLTKDETGYPRLQVIDGANATGILDEFTGLLTEGYAVLERDTSLFGSSYGNPILEAYYTPDATYFYRNGAFEYSISNVSKHPLLVPIINRSDAVRPFGHARISRACMALVKSAARTILRSEISAEFYSYPQKYVTGLAQDHEMMDKWKATMSSLLAFEADENGNRPSVGQFQQQSMTPHNDQLRMFACAFAGETGLTADDLGFVTDNPSSAEAIKSSHENLRLLARKAQRDFGRGFLNVGYLAACLRDDFAYSRRQIYKTSANWYPIFEPDSSMISLIGDGLIKLNQAVPGYIDAKKIDDLTGFKGSE